MTSIARESTAAPPDGALELREKASPHSPLSPAVDGETTAGPSFGPVSVKRIAPALKTFPQPQAVEHREAFMSTHTLAGPCGEVRALGQLSRPSVRGVLASLQGQKYRARCR